MAATRRARRATTRGRRRRRAARARTRRFRDALADQLGTHVRDALAIACTVVGVLLLLGFVSELAGPVGDALDTVAAVLLGDGRIVVPIALLTAAASLVFGGDDEDESRQGVRLGLGLALVGAAVVGLLHLGHGSPGSEQLGPLRDAGGVLGALVGAPLRATLGTAGAVIVAVAAGLLGFLLVVGTGLRDVAHALAAVGRFVAERARALMVLQPTPLDDATSPGDGGAAEAEPDAADPGAPRARPRLFDQLAEGERATIDLVAAETWDDAREEPDDEGVYAEVEDWDEDEDEEQEEADGDEEGEYAEDQEWDDEDGEWEEAGDEEGEYAEDEEWDEDEDGDEEADEEWDDDGEDEVPVVVDWKLPAATVLKRSQSREMDPRLVEAGGQVLEATMREFGVDARLVGATVGPTVTRYELELAAGVKVNKVTGLTKEIAYAMASHDVRILAPIPGRSAIGVEVPNKTRPLVTLGDILASDEAGQAEHPLEVGMGRDIQGRAVLPNLATFPHVLIAGQTGAGKSSCINSIVTSLLMRTTPDEVRIILVDPKRVELGQYNGVPHLLTEVVTNPKKAANALDWAVREMEMRYDLLADVGVRDITGYNAMYDRGDLPTVDDPDPDTGKTYDRLPFIVVVVDELADLMMVAARDVETSICRLAQMARAVGIHLVIATQRPSVDVITGVIKANIPSRLAFSVSTLADSRVILDQPGAEKLIGKGDMLMLTASSSRTERVQGAWVDEDCVRKVVAHWRRQAVQPNYIEGVQGDDSPSGGGRGADDESDDLLDEAMELVVHSGLGSTSMLQRKLRVGFARAGRLMDLLERRGVVGPSEGSKARAVLMTVEELEELRARR
jgi:S-DNA-T family DNA segregation ATPase FtsK/SpoIIIE